MKKVILMVAFLIFGGCSTFTPEQLAAADYGSYPTNYENIVKQYFEMRLKDPASVMYRGMTTPKKWHSSVPFYGTKFGYIVCVSMNAKNSLGGYTGFISRALLIRNGEVIEQDDPFGNAPANGCR